MHAINAWRSEASPHSKDLTALRLALARIEARRDGGSQAASREPFSLGAAEVDAVLGGGLKPACLHEVLAPRGADWSATAGFGLALALRAAQGRPLLWTRQDFLDGETGRLNGVGLAEFGVDPAALSLVRGRDAEAVLRAGVDAARCKKSRSRLDRNFRRAARARSHRDLASGASRKFPALRFFCCAFAPAK